MWNAWKKIVERAANIQSNFTFSVLYFCLVCPIGVLVSLVKDIFQAQGEPKWSIHEDFVSSLKKLKSQ